MRRLRFGRARSTVAFTLWAGSLALVSSSALFSSSAWAAPAGGGAWAERRIETWNRDPVTRAATRDAEKKVRDALERAKDARAVGDPQQHKRLEALARTWAETGDDAARAAKLEEKLAALQRELATVQNKIHRTRALLEETLARVGRAREQIRRLEAERAAPSTPPATKTP